MFVWCVFFHSSCLATLALSTQQDIDHKLYSTVAHVTTTQTAECFSCNSSGTCCVAEQLCLDRSVCCEEHCLCPLVTPGPTPSPSSSFPSLATFSPSFHLLCVPRLLYLLFSLLFLSNPRLFNLLLLFRLRNLSIDFLEVWCDLLI